VNAGEIENTLSDLRKQGAEGAFQIAKTQEEYLKLRDEIGIIKSESDAIVPLFSGTKTNFQATMDGCGGDGLRRGNTKDAGKNL